MNSRKTTKNFIYSILSQIITISMGLLVPRLILVGYGSEINGLLNSVSQFVIYLGLFEAGVQIVAVQALYKPVSSDDRDSINRILSAVNKSYRKTGIAYFVALVCLSAVYPFAIRGGGIGYWTAFGVVMFSGLGNVLLFFFQGKYRILLQAEGKNYILTNLQTIISVLNNIVKIICLSLGCDVVLVLALSFLVNFVQVIYIQRMIKQKYAWIDLKQTPDQKALEQKNAALIHQLSGMVFQNTDVLILTVFCGLKVVSVYSLYKLITSYLGAVIYSLYDSFSFVLGQTFQTDKAQYVKLIDTVEVYFSAIVFSVYTVAAVLFIPFIRLYTAGVEDINYVDTAVCALFIMTELLTFARLPMLNTINYAGRFSQTLPQTLIETTINLTVSLVAVKHFGICGVLFGTCAALLYRDTEVFLFVNHRILNRKAVKTCSIYVINAVILLLLVTLWNMAPFRITSYVQFFVHGLVLTPCVLLLYFTVLSIFYPKERRLILGKIKSFVATDKHVT